MLPVVLETEVKADDGKAYSWKRELKTVKGKTSSVSAKFVSDYGKKVAEALNQPGDQEIILPVFSEFLRTGMVPRFPTLIVSVVMMLAAFLSVVCGLILDTNAKNNRKNFEIQMNIFRILLKRKHED